MRFISTRTHGVIDYIVGVILFFAPGIFGFAYVGGPAVLIPKIMAIGILIITILTRFEVGIIKIIPMSAHLVLDYLGSIFLIASPWLFGFADNPAGVWLPHVIVGILILGQALFTKMRPSVL